MKRRTADVATLDDTSVLLMTHANPSAAVTESHTSPAPFVRRLTHLRVVINGQCCRVPRHLTRAKQSGRERTRPHQAGRTKDHIHYTGEEWPSALPTPADHTHPNSMRIGTWCMGQRPASFLDHPHNSSSSEDSVYAYLAASTTRSLRSMKPVHRARAQPQFTTTPSGPYRTA